MNVERNVEKRLREAFAALPLPEMDLAERVVRQAERPSDFLATVRGRRRVVLFACMLVLMLGTIALATRLGFEVVYLEESSQRGRFELSTEEAVRMSPEGFAQRFEALLDKPIKQEGYSFHSIRFDTVEEAVAFWGVPRMENKALKNTKSLQIAYISGYFYNGKLFGTTLFTRHYHPEKGFPIDLTTRYFTPESYDTPEEGMVKASSATFYFTLDPDNPKKEVTPVIESTTYTSAINGLTAVHSFAYATQDRRYTPLIYNTLAILDKNVLYWVSFDCAQSLDAAEIAQQILDGFVPLDASPSDPQ